jgi:hypothetical protein
MKLYTGVNISKKGGKEKETGIEQTRIKIFSQDRSAVFSGGFDSG